jgi:cyclophilin family peptidyl-prolyl cis-trans isomerase
VPDQSRGKRRRGAQKKSAPPAATPVKTTKPVETASVTSRLPVVPWLTAGAIVVVALIAILVILRPGTGDVTGGAVASASPGASSAAGASGAAAGPCPTSQPPALPAGETRTVTLDTPKGAIAITVEADLSPIAAGNFVALASCGYYDGTVFHRTAALQDGTPFVIQGGDPTGTGTGGPGYTITDEPVTTPYKRGTVAMARTADPNSVGSQYFIVLDDKDGAVLSSANTYQIIGNVTSGMDVADAIFAASGGAENPASPIPVTTATVANP